MVYVQMPTCQTWCIPFKGKVFCGILLQYVSKKYDEDRILKRKPVF